MKIHEVLVGLLQKASVICGSGHEAMGYGLVRILVISFFMAYRVHEYVHFIRTMEWPLETLT